MDDIKLVQLKGSKVTAVRQERKQKILSGLTVIVCLFFLPFAMKNIYFGHYWLGGVQIAFVVSLIVNLLAFRRGVEYPIHHYIVIFLLITTLVLTVRLLGVYGLFWVFPVSMVLQFILPLKMANIFNAIIFICVGYLAWEQLEFGIALRFLLSLMLTLIISSLLLTNIDELQQKLRTESLIDPLTGALNRRQLNLHLKEALAQKKRNNVPAVIMMLDIDNFKKINDTYGHDFGDKVIQSVALVVKDLTREVDLFFRIGGEEFILLMKDTDATNALNIANKLRVNIKQQKLVEELTVTISIGVCSASGELTENSWLKRVDEALYQAKHSGRDKVRYYAESNDKDL